MSAYPESHQDRRVPWNPLRQLAADIFGKCAMPERAAMLLADSLVVADLRGCHSHGVLRVPEYVKKLTVDGVDPQAEPCVVRENGAALVVDGRNAMGQIACEFGMRQAIERASQTGVAICAVRGSNHCGSMGYFAMMALPHDMIGLSSTNALPTMAPWGGCDKIVGNNPLAVAVPAATEPAVVLDAAFSGSSHGKLRVYQQKNAPIPEGWAFDSEGRPTTDVQKAIDGLLQPIGGYKGTGLGIVMGILSAVLSGASYGTELGNMIDGPKPGADGQFLMAIRISAFEEPSRFKERVDRIVRQIRASRRAPGVDRVYAPGELEFVTEQRYRKEGIPLNQITLDAVSRSARQVGLDASFLESK